MPAGRIERLADLLWRILDVSLKFDRTVPPWCLAHSRRRAPTLEAGPLAIIIQYFDDFNAFRDDAHMATWQPLGVQGYVWEAFSHVCGGTAIQSAALWETLAHRGYSRFDYASALAECAQRGWLRRACGDAYTGTDAGKAMRADVDWRTDDYFYAPWRTLSDGEIAETHTLLVALRDGASMIAAEVQLQRGNSMVKFVVELYRKEGWTREQFLNYLAEVHGPLAERMSGLVRYVQNHPAHDLTRKPPGWDAVIELSWRNRESMEADWQSRAGVEATADLNEFADLTHTTWSIVDKAVRINRT